MANLHFLPRTLILALAGLSHAFAAPAPPPAQAPPRAGILVAPTRLVFEDRKRTAEVNLSNVGAVKGDYRISLARMDMDDDGGVKEVPLERIPGEVAIQDLIRFSPRMVTLNPQEAQLVRLQLRLPAELPAGEYRLYMVFREEPPAPEPSATPEGESAKSLSIRISSLFGVAIPVIIRHGETSAKVGMTGITLDPDRKTLRFRLERTGNASVHGDLKATFQPRTGQPLALGEANALSVFTPNAFRNIAMPLTAPLPGAGRIQITFSTPDQDGKKLLAEGSLELP